MMGRIITASTTAPARMVDPVVDTWPPKIGIQPRLWLSHSERGRSKGRITMMPQRPNTIDGTAARRSTR